jgi:hypothetical protein
MKQWPKVSGLIFFFLFAISCGNNGTTDGSTGEPEHVSDFIRLYPEIQLPFSMADSTLSRKEKDSSAITQAVFVKFVPDSVLGRIYPKNAKVKIFPLGRVDAGTETYLLTKTLSSSKPGLLILAYDRKDEFTGAVSFAKPAISTLSQTITMDRKFAITRTILRRNTDGSFSEGKDVFVLNAVAKDFTLIMTEALDDKNTELINPIDTLSRRHKWAGDYSNGKMNLVSIRDGRRDDRLSFYIHFEKNSGECTGELKGEAILLNSTTAEYQLDGDPCILKFVFTKNAVALKEVEGCGSRRGLQCTFDGNYPRKKASRTTDK